MLSQLWNDLIGFTEPYVVPDWGSVVALIPVILAVVAFFYVTFVVYRFATAGPVRRGIRRQTPVPPPGTHASLPSFAPLLAAFGVFMVVLGLVAGGLWLWVGLIILVITLLYWGREALRDYDRLPDAATGAAAVGALPAPATQPPPGVHAPAPSFRPLLVAISMTILVGGLIVGGWALILGAVAVLISGVGWLLDARREYRAVVDADRTGHLETGDAPSWPKATFAALALIIAGALLLSSGVLPNANESAAPPSGAPPAAGGGTGTGSGAGGAAASAAPSLPAADVSIAAVNIEFTPTTLTAPAGREFTIAFDNHDTVPHNIQIKDSSGAVVFTGDTFSGPKVMVYTVPALAPGQYPFHCTIHPNMTGTLTAQ
jgi:plastocyanin